MIPDVPGDKYPVPDTMIPELLARYPQARPVFDRYGLKGCGGRLGPVESVEFFARTHGVDRERLLVELCDAIQQDPTVATAEQIDSGDGSGETTVADAIYRRFFTAGIVLVLTAGATWGAWLLWRIGINGSFTSIPVLQVNAHGHAQIFGWMGLFIMGFAYQAFPRMWHTPLAAPRWAAATFATMLVGLCAQVTAMALAGAWSHALAVAVIGNVLQSTAIAVFASQLAVTFARSGKRFEPYVGFVFAAVGWFVVMSLFALWHTYHTMSALTREELLYYVATYQGPLRDMQVHGLALFMILGVSLRMLPALFDLPAVSSRRAWAGLGLLMTAVLGEIGVFLTYRWTQQHMWAGALWLTWVLLAVGAAVVVWPWRLWRALPTAEARSDRSGKFIRAAYGWLAVSLAMLLALPAYQVISGIPFSHAYYGAIRHAITVGFISLMIMGFAAKVVPTLNGMDTRGLSRLWVPFVLVNVGCFLRVSMQTLTDWSAAFFPVIGFSGMLEVTGLAWWGVGLLRVMQVGKREAAAAAVPGSGPRPAAIEPAHRVADVLAWFPASEPVFVEFGFTAVRHAVFRRTLARQVTLAQACRMHGVALEEFLAALNGARGNLAPLDIGTPKLEGASA